MIYVFFSGDKLPSADLKVSLISTHPLLKWRKLKGQVFLNN